MADASLLITKEDWRKRGFTCGIWDDPPGQVWIDFQYDNDELIMLLDGEMELIIDGKVYYPKLYEEFFIPAGTKHSIKNIGTTSSRWFYGHKI